MAEAYIIDALRTATGRRRGGLCHIHGADLGAHVIKSLVDRLEIPDQDYDDVIFGCVSQVGTQAANIGRNVVLNSKLPISVPGTAVDRQCGSSQQAIHFAAQVAQPARAPRSKGRSARTSEARAFPMLCAGRHERHARDCDRRRRGDDVVRPARRKVTSYSNKLHVTSCTLQAAR